jgi:hypothetical protein
LVNITKVAARRVEPDPAAGPFGGMHSDLAAGARSVEEVEARALHEALIERLARAQNARQDQLGEAFQGGGLAQFQSGLSGMAGPMGSALAATFPGSGDEPSTWQDRYAAGQRAFKRRLYEGEQEPGGGWAPWAAGTGAGMLGYGVSGGRTLLSNLMTGLGIGGVQGGVQGFADPAEGSMQERAKNAALYALGGGLAGGMIGGAGYGLSKAAPQAFNWLSSKLSGDPGWRMSSDRDRLADIARLPYRADWRGERMGEYDPRYFDIEEDVLPHHETGEIIAHKDKLIPKPELQQKLPGAQREEGTIYRGMSADEYENIQKTGLIQSKGEYNIGDQQRGLTYFGHRPEQAEYYAGAFAPPQNKPTFDKPAYVVAVRKPPPEQLGNPDYLGGIESKDEIGVRGALPAEDIQKVYRGNVVNYEPAFEKPGWKQGPRFRLHWEVIDFIKKYGVAAAVGAGLISQEMGRQMQAQGEGG